MVKKDERLPRLRIPLTPDDALKKAMEVDPPKDAKPKAKRRKKGKKKRKA